MSNTADYPLIGRIAIHQVEGIVVDSKLAPVVILEVGAKSLFFVSQLTFPLSESVIYQIKATIAHQDIKLFGTIIQTFNKLGTDAYNYQFVYLLSEKQFIPLLSKVPRLDKPKSKTSYKGK